MNILKCSAVSYSITYDPQTLDEWKTSLFTEINSFVEDGSSVILYPEYFLMGLFRYFDEVDPVMQMRRVAEYVSEELLKEVKALIGKEDVLLVLGSAPRIIGNRIFNSSPILHKGKWSFQDKLYLTPWECDLTPGTELKLFKYHGLKVAVMICFDIEQPDLALKLKKEGIDLILVPSATTDKNGSQRVNRCASSRSIELGAFVITAPLVGDSVCDLIDHNEGRQAFFLPAQADATFEQENYSSYSDAEKVVEHYSIYLEMAEKLKTPSFETKPYLKEVNSKINLVN